MAGAQEVSFLTLKQAFTYAGDEDVPEFSGLCFKDGTLYSVNDKQENYLYKLRIDTNSATFSSDRIQIAAYKDFEGICHYQNAFYVIEEKECRVYKIINNNATPYGAAFLTSLKSKRLVDTGEGGNRQIEGFAMLSDSTFLIATERTVTSLATINIRGEILSGMQFPPLHFSDTCLPSPLLSKSSSTKDANSFSDLCIYKGKAYLLEREKKMIHVIDISRDPFVITRTLSFKNDILPCDEYHDYYGAAEGLAIDDQYIYIILDNNEKQNLQCNKRGRTLFQFYNK